MKKLKIAVCDDYKEAGIKLRDIILLVCKNPTETEVDLYVSGICLLEQIKIYGVVFLDVEMPQINGIKLGIEIHKINPKCQIIIASGKEIYFKEAFKINAIRYITKPFFREEVSEALNYFYETEIEWEEFEVYLNREKYMINQKAIQYIRAFNGYTEYYIANQVFRKDISLNAAKQLLNEKMFYKINRQYLVNFRWVEKCIGETIKVGSVQLKIARRKRQEFISKYMDFDIKYGRNVR